MNDFLLDIVTPASCSVTDLMVSLLRIAIGCIMFCHGIEKMYGGKETWRALGATMSNFGINWMPVMWGFLAASAEFFGGIALIAGIGTRIASFFLACVMVVAITMQVRNGDSYRAYSHALTLLVVFLSFMVIGSGSRSFDYVVSGKNTPSSIY